MANKRSGKWYRKNEAQVMEALGLKPTVNSGSGWVEKEDGQNENVICQLKSTDANSIRIQLQDLHTIEYNALVAHKLPVFAVQFIQDGEVWLLVKPSQVEQMAKYIKTGESSASNDLIVDVGQNELEDTVTCPVRKVRSSSKARESFSQEYQKRFAKKTRSAK